MAITVRNKKVEAQIQWICERTGETLEALMDRLAIADLKRLAAEREKRENEQTVRTEDNVPKDAGL